MTSSEQATGQGERFGVRADWAGGFCLAVFTPPGCPINYLQSTSILLAFHKHYARLSRMNSNPAPQPQLAPPGAGLPEIELIIARAVFAVRRLTGNRESFNTRFEQERVNIRRLVRPLDAESAARRVLIKRVPGLEDSSRYWSVWMTLDHLRIIHGSMTRIIGALTNGVKLPGTASTAAVKPSPQVTGKVVAEYEKSCDDLLAKVAAVTNLRTSLRYAHPWFGPLDAAGWHALAPGHLGIHRIQIERILQGLSAPP
jgi:hypothetical protein